MPRKKTLTTSEAAAVEAAMPPSPEEWADWVEPAWKLFMRGQAVWSQLARRYGVDRETVKRQVMRFHEAARMGLLLSHEDAHARYVGGLQEIAEAAWADHASCSPKDLNAKAGFLRIAMDAMKNLAAASGVVTERSAQENDVNVNFNADGLVDAIRELVADAEGEADGAGGAA